jgi:hypothetical protein
MVMHAATRWLVISVGVLVVGLPVAIVATLLLLPFWSWLETRSGIESVGHSGPAEWCYLTTYVFIVTCGLAALWKRTRRSGP